MAPLSLDPSTFFFLLLCCLLLTRPHPVPLIEFHSTLTSSKKSIGLTLIDVGVSHHKGHFPCYNTLCCSKILEHRAMGAVTIGPIRLESKVVYLYHPGNKELNPSSSSDPSALECQDATATSFSIPQNHHSYNYTLVCVEGVGFLVSVSSCSCWLYYQVFITSASGDYVPTEVRDRTAFSDNVSQS